MFISFVPKNYAIMSQYLPSLRHPTCRKNVTAWMCNIMQSYLYSLHLKHILTNKIYRQSQLSYIVVLLEFIKQNCVRQVTNFYNSNVISGGYIPEQQRSDHKIRNQQFYAWNEKYTHGNRLYMFYTYIN